MFVHESLVPKVVACGPCNLEFYLISLCNHVSCCKYHVGLFIDHLPVVSKVCRVCILILKDQIHHIFIILYCQVILMWIFTISPTCCIPTLTTFFIVFHFIWLQRVTPTSALLVMFHSLIWPWSLICHNFTSARLCDLWRTLIAKVWK